MKKLYLVGIADHLEYKKEYFNAVKKTGANDVFIEEMNDSWQNSCQKKLYYELISNGMNLIPIYPIKNIIFDNLGISFLELSYALAIKKNLEDKDYCFTVGGMHLSPKEELESSLEYAIKLVDCKVEIVKNNFFIDYPKNYEETINNRKKIISRLIEETLV